MSEKTTEMDKMYLSAWGKICDYIRKEYNGKFPGGVRINKRAEVDTWCSLVVDEFGEPCMFYFNGHLDDNPSYVYFDNKMVIKALDAKDYRIEKKDLSGLKKQARPMFQIYRIKHVVDRWQEFKRELQYEKSKVEKLRNFEV